MRTHLVFTILLAIQLLGFDSADEYAFDVLQASAVVHTLETRREGPIVRLMEDGDTVLEIERSQLYGHMYTVYTAADSEPRAFSLLDAILQIPSRAVSSFRITVAQTEVDRAKTEDEPGTSWDVFDSGERLYVSSTSESLVVVVYPSATLRYTLPETLRRPPATR